MKSKGFWVILGNTFFAHPPGVFGTCKMINRCGENTNVALSLSTIRTSRTRYDLILQQFTFKSFHNL